MPLQLRDLESVLQLWPDLDGATMSLLNHSENHTILLSVPGGEAFTMRVHRPGYQSVANIESELAWLEALHRQTDLPIPEPVAGRNGRMLQSFKTPSGDTCYAVLFHFIQGSEPNPDSDLVDLFGTLGVYAAKLHQHSIAWPRPAGFERQAWSAPAILDMDGLWGDWRVAPGVNDAIRLTLNRAHDKLRRRLEAYGTASARYGLIHADMRLGNLLVDGDQVSLIDFDDCGICWFAYDFAAAISFHETHPSVPALRDAWLKTYQTVRPLAPEDIAELDSMVLLRRTALLAWIGSHAETALAQTHMPGFAEGTADLAERYMAGAMWR
ncbi:Ser/Thr protein kinase RdoA involved in Cpx stress response, MazF antagonist [Devosia lucknowensis]|uniref:Ser/Thr protein kinase RdoA involved in Cpx stress response, MazF antagonist n=1 Tax=Devosia lucknowensis TaxID=1096929 RepID=A0A1Y6EKF1_9HYPH|nr:phosphotransferase [Devosia lucknowensis]SMQ63077.1 Ser/Thr protein kinase RdoA involved in Cpx stress response, MazF antagonist [Devosia lucknowensis]